MDPLSPEVLDSRECWDLLRGCDVGRLALCIDGRPDIFPVNYVVDHGSVVLRTAVGTKYAALREGAAVAFEVDGVDEEAGIAWSVEFTGTAGELKNLYDLLDAARLPLRPLHDAPKPFFIRLEPDRITGRRFSVAARDRWTTELTEAIRSSVE